MNASEMWTLHHWNFIVTIRFIGNQHSFAFNPIQWDCNWDRTLWYAARKDISKHSCYLKYSNNSNGVKPSDKRWFLWFEVNDGERIIQRMHFRDDGRCWGIKSFELHFHFYWRISIGLAKIVVKFSSGWLVVRTLYGFDKSKNDFPDRINWK